MGSQPLIKGNAKTRRWDSNDRGMRHQTSKGFPALNGNEGGGIGETGRKREPRPCFLPERGTTPHSLKGHAGPASATQDQKSVGGEQARKGRKVKDQKKKKKNLKQRNVDTGKTGLHRRCYEDQQLGNIKETWVVSTRQDPARVVGKRADDS